MFILSHRNRKQKKYKSKQTTSFSDRKYINTLANINHISIFLNTVVAAAIQITKCSALGFLYLKGLTTSFSTSSQDTGSIAHTHTS